MKILTRLLVLLGVPCLALPAVIPGLPAVRSLAAEELTCEKEFSRELQFEPGGKLCLKNQVGNIEITGWDKNRIELRAVKKVRYCSDPKEEPGWLARKLNIGRRGGRYLAYSEEEARQWLDKIEINISQDSGHVEIETVCPENDDNSSREGSLKDLFGLVFNFSKEIQRLLPFQVLYTLLVPRATSVSVDNEIGEIALEGLEGEINTRTHIGKIFMRDVAGNIEAGVEIGEITVEQVQGRLKAWAKMGSISVEKQRLAEGDDTELDVDMGRITLKVPRTSRAELNLSTDIGSVETDFRSEIVDGTFENREVTGKLNGGGPLIRMNVDIGSVSLAEL